MAILSQLTSLGDNKPPEICLGTSIKLSLENTYAKYLNAVYRRFNFPNFGTFMFHAPHSENTTLKIRRLVKEFLTKRWFERSVSGFLDSGGHSVIKVDL